MLWNVNSIDPDQRKAYVFTYDKSGYGMVNMVDPDETAHLHMSVSGERICTILVNRLED